MPVVAPRTRFLAPAIAMNAPHPEAAKPVRVLFFNTRDHRGADVDVHISLMRSFDPRKTQTFLLSNSQAADASIMRDICQKIPDLRYDFLPLGVPMQNLETHRIAAKAGGTASVFVSMLRGAAFVHRNRINIIHSTDRPRDAAFSTFLARMTGTPNIVHMHSNAGSHLSRASCWGMRNATSLFAVSAATKNEMVEIGLPENKISVVHNATDPKHFDPTNISVDGALTRSRLGIPVEAPVIGIVARLNAWKGQRELIEATARLAPSQPNLHLLVLGVGSDSDHLHQMALKLGLDKRIKFLGWQEDVRPYLGAMDLFCLPSHAEPFGLAITEAMSMALPVIACCSGGVPEIINHGEHGWLVAPQSAEELQNAIEFLLARPAYRRKLGEAARQHIIECFTPARQSSLVSQLYEEIVRCHSVRRCKLSPP